VTAEAIPVARPLKNPLAPSCWAPAIGWATRDTTPARTPFPMDFVAEEKPADASLGRRVENRELNTALAFGEEGGEWMGMDGVSLSFDTINDIPFRFVSFRSAINFDVHEYK